MDLSSYILSKRYTDETVIGGGAIKGASCQIQSIEPTEGGNNVTFVWELEDGTNKTATLFIEDGKDGKDGLDGKDGAKGEDGLNGEDGYTPEIGANGHWFINGVDTGVVAAPDLSGYFNEDNLVPLTGEEIDQLCAVEEV